MSPVALGLANGLSSLQLILLLLLLLAQWNSKLKGVELSLTKMT